MHGTHSWFDCPNNPRNQGTNRGNNCHFDNNNNSRYREVNMNTRRNQANNDNRDNGLNNYDRSNGRSVRWADRSNNNNYDTPEETKEYYSNERELCSTEKVDIDELHKEENLVVAHPETLVAMLCNHEGSRHKVVRGFMDACATDSLIEREVLDGDLNSCAENRLVNDEDTSTQDTGNGLFKSPGSVKLLKVYLPVFAKNRKFSTKFHTMPKRKRSPNSHEVIIGMKDLRHLKFIIDLNDTSWLLEPK